MNVRRLRVGSDFGQTRLITSLQISGSINGYKREKQHHNSRSLPEQEETSLNAIHLITRKSTNYKRRIEQAQSRNISKQQEELFPHPKVQHQRSNTNSATKTFTQTKQYKYYLYNNNYKICIIKIKDLPEQEVIRDT